jgi:hypothetical protein
MRLSLALSFALLSMVVGCARNAKPVSVDASDWTPPGEVDVKIRESARGTAVAKEGQAEACRPNKTEIPTKNAVHPAVY